MKRENKMGPAFPIPAVALRGLVVFPGMMLHFDVGRKKSIAALKTVMEQDQKIFLIAQKNMADEDPKASDLYTTGVVANVKQVLKLPNGNGTVRVAVEGLYRARLDAILSDKPYLNILVRKMPDTGNASQTQNKKTALLRRAKDVFGEYSENVPQLPPELVMAVMDEDDPGKLADYVAGNIMLEHADRQKILDELNPTRRLERLCVLLARESELMRLEEDIQERVQNQIDQNQREYYLREQMKTISQELNHSAGGEDEVQQFRDAIQKLKASQEVCDKLLRECDRLERVSVQSPEGTVIRSYIETCLALPWQKYSKEKLDLNKAKRVLARDHYGLDKVKERMLEYLAVRKLVPDIKGQIICLVGPPGVGKTSVARSVAKAMGREYVRISLGGVRDEAEIRGHRKTYIGSMPGRIINAMQQAGTANPLILLDEVDKLSNDFRGDPSSALLEVLDPEQNHTFRDHYIELPFDLSRVLFMTTANVMQNIPAPLRDRMEVIELGSYTHEEKFQIAKRHLLPKQAKRHGLTGNTLRVTDKALHAVISGYTREAGVRKLEQVLAAICRKAASRIALGEKRVQIRDVDLEALLGAQKYRQDSLRERDEVGVVNGLAWTSVGGDMLEIEVAILPGKGKLQLTGSLGDVMKESAQAAISYIRANAKALQISPTFHEDRDIHIHVPEGAVPKDGPSAGVTITTALVSALSGIPAKREVAMTGEVTLRGRVLPIGGLKEKAMAAYQTGIQTIVIPQRNVADLDEVDPVVLQSVQFVPVTQVNEVLAVALQSSKTEIQKQPMPAQVTLVDEPVAKPKHSAIPQ